jgi:hypothetical protein
MRPPLLAAVLALGLGALAGFGNGEGPGLGRGTLVWEKPPALAGPPGLPSGSGVLQVHGPS